MRSQSVIGHSVSGQVEENVYVRMHSCHGKEGTDYDDETRQGKEEESAYGKQTQQHMLTDADRR